MKVKGVIFEDFVNYKKPSMYIIFPTCDFKCDRECGRTVCQNSALAHAPIIEIDKDELIEEYLNNPITEAIVLAGLEPFDSPLDLFPFVDALRRQYKCMDDIVIYTGYTEDELKENSNYKLLTSYDNIIVKFGRFIPNEEPHLDKLLGVKLASPNQYARLISKKENNE